MWQFSYQVFTRSGAFEPARKGNSPSKEAHSAVKTEPTHSKLWMGQRTRAGREDCSCPKPQAKQSKGRRRGIRRCLEPLANGGPAFVPGEQSGP